MAQWVAAHHRFKLSSAPSPIVSFKAVQGNTEAGTIQIHRRWSVSVIHLVAVMIAATAPVIGADDEESPARRRISSYFLFNVIAALTFLTFGGMLGMIDQRSFGPVCVGNAVNDTLSVRCNGSRFRMDDGIHGSNMPESRSSSS